MSLQNTKLCSIGNPIEQITLNDFMFSETNNFYDGNVAMLLNFNNKYETISA